MYNDIGGKIKGLAKAIFIFETFISIVMGFVFIILAAQTPIDVVAINPSAPIIDIISGLLLIVVGPIVAWISSWLLYGFGELISKTCDIAENTSHSRFY